MNPPQMKSGGAPPNLVVIGGLDPRGGAGLLRDVRTAAMRGAHTHAVGTAWTEQDEGVHRVETRVPEALAAAVRQAVARGPDAVKIGMVGDPTAMAAVLKGLGAFTGPVVVDPVLASSRGGALWQAAPLELLPLLRRATLVTPNAPEAAALTGRPVASVTDAEAAGAALCAAGVAAVLVKGGHLGGAGDAATDVLITARAAQRFTRPRVPGAVPRGTGCALATAIAVELARGATLESAVAIAGAWLADAIANAADVAGERHLP